MSLQRRSPLKRKGYINDTRHQKDRSKDQEREIAKEYTDVGLPARRVPGSGSFSILPGDVDVPSWLLGEAKQTRTGKLTLQPEWIRKIKDQARQMGRPWYVVHAWVAEATGPYEKLVIIDESTWYELLGRLKEAENGKQESIPAPEDE